MTAYMLLYLCHFAVAAWYTIILAGHLGGSLEQALITFLTMVFMPSLCLYLLIRIKDGGKKQRRLWVFIPTSAITLLMNGLALLHLVQVQATPSSPFAVVPYAFFPCFTVPGWLLPMCLGLFIVYGIEFSHPKNPTQNGYCPVCFYSLIGNVSGACPECGTLVSSSTED